MGKDFRGIDGCIVGRVQAGHRVVLTGSEGFAADDHARALYGAKSNPSAVSMAVATSALQMMVPQSTAEPIELDTVLSAHKMLMEDDPAEHRCAARLREVQNWIGGSDYTPRGALYVPPPPDTVPSYMSDLIEIVERDELPVLIQAAAAHPQFESIHPFTDGNGRIGRALINSILRFRSATSHVVVPVASALDADRNRYFETLTTQ